MILLIDNYDSFSYNLYQLIGSLDPDIKVIRNDELTVGEIEKLKPERIILSPGPGRPENAGVCIETVKALGDKIPILGVCLGHQSICKAYGGVVTYAKELMHGKKCRVTLDNSSVLFKDMPHETEAARYHSLAAERGSLPDVLRITGTAPDGEIMAVEHKEYPVYGLQFHPESILTPLGKNIISAFLNI